MPGPRVDPSDYARQRQESIARANEMRATRRNRGGGDDADGGGDSLDELAGRSANAAEKSAGKRPRREVAPGWTMHTDKKTGKPYYHHAGSGKTTWVKPPGCADDVENAPLRENGAVSQPRSTPGRRDLPRDMTEPRSTARAEPADAPMSEAEFEGWLDVLKRRSLTGSQARRVSTLLQRYSGHAASDADAAYGYGSSRAGTSGEGRSSSSRATSDSSTNAPRATLSRTTGRRAGRRPEWNDNFAVEDDAPDGDEAPAEQPRRRAEPRQPKSPRRRDDGAAALPPGWTQHTDRRTGNVFYRNEARGESTWTRPAAPNRDDRSPPRRTGAAAPKLPAATKGPDSESRHRTLWKPKSARGDRSDDDDDDGRRDDAYRRDDGHAKPKSQPRDADDRGGSRPTGGYGAVPADASAAPDGGAAELDDACVVAARHDAEGADGLEKRHGQRCCPCAPKKARKTFNAAAHRADGFDGDEKQMVKKAAAEVKKELRRKERDGGAAAPGGKDKKWKAQSNQLREAMQAMRGVAAAEKAGKPPPPMVASTPDPSFVQCPHCSRTFNEKAAERHIPKCQSIKAKPKSLARGGPPSARAASPLLTRFPAAALAARV
ncbi:hypothetical protein JL722_13707 [Aureococcus anophagefferens]|nr:hypothetical protein JL722_13707 [Aureococcus anophagefferens]